MATSQAATAAVLVAGVVVIGGVAYVVYRVAKQPSLPTEKPPVVVNNTPPPAGPPPAKEHDFLDYVNSLAGLVDQVNKGYQEWEDKHTVQSA